MGDSHESGLLEPPRKLMDLKGALSGRWPEKTATLANVFRDTAASYKFFWFLGLLNLVEREADRPLKETEVVTEMIALAWSPVCFYRLSLGVQDKLQDAVKELQRISALPNEVQPSRVREEVELTTNLGARVRALCELVPTRFLSPWFNQQIARTDGQRRTRLIRELANESKWSALPTPYGFDNRTIIVHPSWRAFLLENIEVLRAFSRHHLCLYLQARNPNAPGIVNKLSIPAQRDLGPARKFWRTVRNQFAGGGRSQLFSDIYSGEPLHGDFSIDHFLPWSFVAHDLLWNLVPVNPRTNSIKGDQIPDESVYLPKMAHLHREAVVTLRNTPRLLEDHALCFQRPLVDLTTMDADGFTAKYRELFAPQIQIALNQGFSGRWVLRN